MQPNHELLKNEFSEMLEVIHHKLGRIVFSPDSEIDITKTSDDFFKKKNLNGEQTAQLQKELLAMGPLEEHLNDPLCLEIFVNGVNDVFIEHAKKGFLRTTGFLSKWSFDRIFAELCRRANCTTDLSSPIAQGTVEGFRFQTVTQPVSCGSTVYCLRRIKCVPFLAKDLVGSGWCTIKQLETVSAWIKQRRNLLIIGPTGVGKTSIINFLLKNVGEERLIILEDSDEILCPNDVSIKLLTREESEHWKGFAYVDLLKVALRLRPSRIVLGELRGEEAKDYLLAMSSGHDGAITSLHASCPQSALKRLELLITLGAPQWHQLFVRDLIFQTVHGVIWLGFDNDGNRKMKGIYTLSSNEKFGITVDPVL